MKGGANMDDYTRKFNAAEDKDQQVHYILTTVYESLKEKDMDVATRVSVQLQLTDPDLRSRDRVVKKSEKDSLYAAMDVGTIWLERALAGKL